MKGINYCASAYPSPLVDAGLPQHRLGGLAPAEAMTLLDASAQPLSPVIRDRLLSEAAGNPLALTEQPITAARREPIAPGSLPLTQRLEQAFAARVSDLPEATRLLLLVAAHSDDERLSDIVEAAGAVAGKTLGLDLLEPAAEAAIVDLDLHSVRFRHPLIRSAVRQSASLLRRRRVHEALAEVLRAEPDRRVWHRAALISGMHEQIANELEEAAGSSPHSERAGTPPPTRPPNASSIRRARRTTRLSRAGSSEILPKQRCTPARSTKHERA